ncbi:Paired amphipathic helix protein Sin3a [Schistosoma japonicum]|nr:Paired amphipathic helix protein Sin3a [Schistosoma japonicum]
MMKCLKVEDALSYLDQVKARFSGQGAIYMDFLDVMRDFKAQTIGTEVVIRRVRELFEGHPDLITGFNTFIPQGYRMDAPTSHQSFNTKPNCTVIPSRTTLSISSADNVTPVKGVCAPLKISEAPSEWTPPGSLTGLAGGHYESSGRPNSHVSVVPNNLPLGSVSSPVHVLTPNIQPDNPNFNPSSQQQLIPADSQENLPNIVLRSSHNATSVTQPHVYQQHQQIQSFHHALQYVNKIKNRFQGIPDVYKRFLDILQWYQKEQRHSDPMCRKQAELQVYQDVAKLFDGQEDLLQEFSQFFPESFGVTSAVSSRNSSPEGFGQLHCHTPTFGREKHDRDKHSTYGFSCDPHTCSDGLSNNVSNQPPASLISLVSEVSQKRLDLDFTKLRTCGVSYRALPSNFPQSKCSGRQKCPVAKEVLNDSYISFSSLTSEDSQFVSSKKNQYEENMYRVEDERYEVDMVTELNRAAMQNLVVVKRRMDRMSKEELNQFHLDDKLGGTSAILMRKAIHRVYGDKAGDVIYGLKNCPNTVLPLVIQRMRQKDTEWRETIRNYQRSWADQDTRNYLRSLDHQGATFKQRDAPFIRSKTMISQIETIARNDKTPSCHSTSDPVGKMISTLITQQNLISRDISNPGTMGSALANVLEGNNEDESAHLTLVYPPPDVRNALLEDAASLIIHHVKRQSNASKNDKRSMKCLVRTVLQDIFLANRFPMSDDEDDEDEDEDVNHKEDEDEPTDDLIENEENCRNRSIRHLKSTKRFPESRKSVSTEQTIFPTTDHAEFDQIRKDDIKLQTEVLGVQNDVLSSKSKSDDLNFPELSMESNATPYHINQDNSTNELRNMELTYLSNLPKHECYSVLYGNNHWYSFLRLHHLLLCRLHHLRSHCAAATQEVSSVRNEYHVQAAEVLRLRRYGGTEPSQYYSRALNLVKDLLDGGEDINTFEDRLRDMFGIYAYPWFTMDRLVINIVRQLQALASGDELSRRLTALHRSWIGNSTYSDRNSQSTSVTSNFSQYSNVCGPLYTRVCRLANESAYHSQAMSICSAFAGANASCNVGSSSGTTFVSNNSQSNTITTSNSNNSSWPNCFLIVVLSEASTMLIRLIKPVHSTQCEGEKGHDLCFPYSGHTNFIPHSLSVSSIDPGITDRKIHLHNENFKPNPSIRHWYDYLTTHLSWTIGYVPHSICSRIRPVFLYRNVRRCVNALTRNALQRRQQLLIDTGDVQPEEVLLQGLVSSDDKNPFTANNSKTSEQFKSPSTSNFKRDVWEFMIRVFKNDLTHKELFRDTFSSDCMHSTERLDSRVSRNHKINWSVGSYGIFIRYHRRTCRKYSPAKWRKFHSDWLAKHRNCIYILNEDKLQNNNVEVNLDITEKTQNSASITGSETMMLEKPTHENLDIGIISNNPVFDETVQDTTSTTEYSSQKDDHTTATIESNAS